MKLQSFCWLSHHGIIRQNNMLYDYGKRICDSFGRFYFYVILVSCIFDIFNYLLLLEKHIYSNFLSFYWYFISL